MFNRQMESTINEIRRINMLVLLAESGDKKKDSAEKGETSPSYISQILGKNIKKRREIGSDLARKLEDGYKKPRGWMDQLHITEKDYFDSNPDSVSLGLRQNDNTTSARSPVHYSARSTVERGPDINGRVPLISNVQAGMWTEIIDNFHVGDAEDWIPTTARITDSMFALRVVGDSMVNPAGFPSLPPGVIVIVDPETSPENGDIVIARLDDSMDATIKKLVIDGNQKFLKPLNPHYPVIPINGNCTIVGVAVKVEFDLK